MDWGALVIGMVLGGIIGFSAGALVGVVGLKVINALQRRK